MRRIIIALIASAGVLSSCSDFLGTDPDNRTYIDTPEKVFYVNFGYTDAAVDGITVPARSYAAHQEVSK